MAENEGGQQDREISASRRLGYHPHRSVRDVFAELEQTTADDVEQDHYGAGAVAEAGS